MDDHSRDMDDLSEKLRVLKILLKSFKLERIANLILSFISVIFIVYLGFEVLDNKNENHLGSLFAMGAPGGAITYSVGRLLKMWSDSLKFLSNAK